MMNATNNIATDLFYKIRSRFSGLKLGTESGEITINPEDARFFDFDYKDKDETVGHVSISLAEENSIKVYFSTGITEGMQAGEKHRWYGFLKELRQFAKRHLMAFDTRDIAKDNLDKRDYAFLSQNAKPKQQQNTIQTPVGESIMSESQMYGTKTVSYQKLMDTRLIVKHSHTLNDDMAPGARSRNISALFVENQDGERFKYPFVHLAGARAMQRHVANSGLPYDDIGKSIVSMSEQIAQLRSFSNYVVRNDLMNSDTNSIVEQSKAALDSLREQVARMAKQNYYESYKESFQAQQPLEVPQDVVEEYTDKFTVKNFKEDIRSVFPILYKLMKENSKVDYDDIVAMTTTESINDEADVELGEDRDEFAEFESWVMGLGEDSGITSLDEEERMLAVKSLQDLIGQEFPAGVDGNNAITSLQGIIEDSDLFQAIKEVAKTDPDTGVQSLIKIWLEQNAPDVVGELDFGATDQQPSIEGIDEAARSGDYEIDGEMATVEFVRNPSGAVQVTKVMVGSTDVTDIEDLDEIAGNIDDSDESPIEDYYLILSVNVDAEYSPAERGSREFGTGMQLEPDYPESSEVTGVTAYGNGKSVSLDTDDFPNSTQEQIQDIADRQHSSGDDYSPDDNYDDRYEGAEEGTGPKKSDIPAYLRKQKGGDDWKMSSKDVENEKNQSPTTKVGLEKRKQQLDIKEVAAFINSFYDRDSGTFPKGPEGVATMVGKKFGEQAETVARKFVERMAPEQSTEQNPELQELARIRELSGIRQGIGF